MDLENAYQWVLTYGYHIGQALLLLAALLQLKHRKSPLTIACFAGFACFVAGTFVMLQSDGNFLEFAQRQAGFNDYSSGYMIGKSMNVVGLLVGAGAWFLNSLDR